MMFFKDTARYDLRLDQSTIFVSQSQNAEFTNSITGKFCVSLPELAVIKRIKVRLTGLLKIPRDGCMIADDRECLTFSKSQTLASSKTLDSFRLPAGTYEFVFSIPLATEMFETVTGPSNNHTYQVDAIVEHRYWRNTVISQPVRIYNVPDLEANDILLEIPPTVEGQSDQNIQYCISMPNSDIPFGSTFFVDACFAAPAKDAKLSAITITVVEKHIIKVQATAVQASLHNVHNITSTKALTVFTERTELAQESISMGPEWRLSQPVRLPQNLRAYSQSISSRTINITHSLILNAEFQDENGQAVVKIAETIPFSIYMTPGVIRDDGSVHGKVVENNRDPPPPYGCHTFDPRLFESGMDSCGNPMMLPLDSDCGAGRLGHCQNTLGPAPCYDLVTCSGLPGYDSARVVSPCV
ncbi:uncharacterized protein BDW43DRAFT_284119 [Aspergillus alliaceus]|uniref:uncharacterized protein n=1 Tax=Petromyces alliaceus TaxID=209559 RepID=UPI0012A4A845|nr:uncharacterized protein BDW43DRAFT_284119 [Aspergillus alliaceus]KAB8230844.1 hypothetical protein BDW43DRAFT_284119 [Aspergillus alliaceus]